MQDDDEDGGEAYDLSKMSKENGEEEEVDPVKVHEIKFDEFGIMDDGLDDATADQLKGAEGKNVEKNKNLLSHKIYFVKSITI